MNLAHDSVGRRSMVSRAPCPHRSALLGSGSSGIRLAALDWAELGAGSDQVTVTWIRKFAGCQTGIATDKREATWTTFAYL